MVKEKSDKNTFGIANLDVRVIYIMLAAALVLVAIFVYATFLKVNAPADTQSKVAEEAQKINVEFPLNTFTSEAEVVKVEKDNITVKKEGLTVVIKIEADTKYYREDGTVGSKSEIDEGDIIKTYFAQEKLKAIRY
ncbi:hypothetical protein COY62_03890 [bacterium (Candidatus Howlettbacteria) CG_4_10_14_0_8_um_filter_40_9]|nr:MAG: hypothetical protein COY62_03890 [bacterium (Candidatus Howlettbacteria) CG_4_10_14_0_8_um_filter_40_9]